MVRTTPGASAEVAEYLSDRYSRHLRWYLRDVVIWAPAVGPCEADF